MIREDVDPEEFRRMLLDLCRHYRRTTGYVPNVLIFGGALKPYMPRRGKPPHRMGIEHWATHHAKRRSVRRKGAS